MDNFYKNLLKSCLDTPKSGNTTSRDTVLGMKPGSSFDHSKNFGILGVVPNVKKNDHVYVEFTKLVRFGAGVFFGYLHTKN